MVFSLKVKQPQSIAGLIWNFVQDLAGTGATVLIVLRIIGVIHWSWWWVLAPLWLGGIQLSISVLVLLVTLLWGLRRS